MTAMDWFEKHEKTSRAGNFADVNVWIQRIQKDQQRSPSPSSQSTGAKLSLIVGYA